MSAKIMGAVFDCDLTPNKTYVLLAMADHADHDGKNVYPRLGYIAWKTGYSLQSIKRIVADLRDDDILIPDGFTVGGVVKYQIDLAHVPQKTPYSETAQGRPKGSPNYGPKHAEKNNPSYFKTGLDKTHNHQYQLIKSNSRTSNLETEDSFEKLSDLALEEVREQ